MCCCLTSLLSLPGSLPAPPPLPMSWGAGRPRIGACLRGLQNRTCFLGPGGFMLGPDAFAFPPGAYGFLVCKMGMLMISWSPQPPCRMGVRFKQAKCETPAKGPRQL